MKPENYHIRKIQIEDIPIIEELIFPENWNIGFHDIEFFAENYPDNFWVGEMENDIIGCILGLEYNKELAFFGLYIVDPKYRNQKYGVSMALEAIENTTSSIFGNDGVIEQVPQYERNGFKIAHKNIRLSGLAKSNKPSNPDIHLLKGEIPEELFLLDQSCFRTNRNDFIQKWLKRKDVSCVYAKTGDIFNGYAMLRPGQEGFIVGPLYAESFEIASALLKSLQNQIIGESFYLEIPETNPYIEKLKSDFNLTAGFNLARMFTKQPKEIPIEKVFANMCNISG